MESNILYQGKIQELVEDFIDIGYMAENIEVLDTNEQKRVVKRSNPERSMTLLLSFPTCKEFQEEILSIDAFMSDIQVDIACYFIFKERSEETQALQKKLQKFEVVYDSEEEFGNMYGTLIVNGSLEGKLTKSLFLISKDGAVFYLNMPQNIEDLFNLERLQAELNRAYVTYTGVGCHG